MKGERVETKERTTRRRSRCMLSSIEQCFSCANASAGGGGKGYGRRCENRNMCTRVGPLQGSDQQKRKIVRRHARTLVAARPHSRTTGPRRARTRPRARCTPSFPRLRASSRARARPRASGAPRRAPSLGPPPPPRVPPPRGAMMPAGAPPSDRPLARPSSSAPRASGPARRPPRPTRTPRTSPPSWTS